MKRESTLLITAVLALVLLGVLMMYSAASGENGNLARLIWQMLFVAAGLVAMYIAAHFDYRRFSDPTIYRAIVVSSIILLALVLVPGIGVEVNGARRWISVAGFRFQPSEMAKFALIVLLAAKLAQQHESTQSFFKGFLPSMLIGAFFAGMVFLERDLGIPALLMMVTLAMLFVAGVRWSYLAASLLPLSGAMAALIIFWPHRLKRFGAFIDPWQDRAGDGFHLIQSLMGFANGGVWGVGAGAGEQKLGYLYAANTDFVFAVLGEELGLFGTLATLALFLLLTFVACWVAMNAHDLFGCLLASGIAALISGQAALVMAVTIGLLPTKGLPLPFISHGGTALVITLGLAGILVNVAVQASPPKRKTPKRAAV